MFRPSLLAAVLFLSLAWRPALAVEISIDTSAARAVLDALADPHLTRAQALAVARMPGNRGPVRELQGFGIQASEDDLADALFKTAHGEPVTKKEQSDFFLDRVRPRLAELTALLDRIEREPEHFQQAIEKRIGAYSPPGMALKLTGYVVAAGDGGGYAFGSTDFYLNLVMVDSFAQARSITTHELYHAVQGGLRARRDPAEDDDKAPPSACRAAQKLFGAMYREGSAVEVADVSLLAEFTTPNSSRQRIDMEDGAKHLPWSFTLLEMSIASFEARAPLPYQDVYAVDFYGHAVLYNAAYAIARAIAEAEGAGALTTFLTRPSADFMHEYTQLPSYGKDREHPAFGPNTLAMLERVRQGCRTAENPAPALSVK